MPLQDLWTEKLDRLDEFMLDPTARVLSLRHAPDMRQPLLRVLLGLEADEENPHLFVYFDQPYDSPEEYFPALLEGFVRRNERFREDLADVDVSLPAYKPPRSRKGWRPTDYPADFAGYASEVAECLPDPVGALIFVFEPTAIGDAASFAWALESLSFHTKSDWCKYIVLDDLKEPSLEGLDERDPACHVLPYHTAPEEVEDQVQEDLASGLLTPEGTFLYTLMAAAFAASKGSDDAEQLQLQALDLARRNGTPADQANALYNLGNNYLEKDRWEDAEEAYLEAAQLCVDVQANPLLALVLGNLGAALYRLQRPDQAVESFDVARRTFAALGNPPGEAHVLDSKARTLALAGRTEDAEQAWLEALAVYDGITAPHMSDVRTSGRDSIMDTLERFYEETQQAGKLSALRTEGS